MSLNDFGYSETDDHSPDPGTPQTGTKAWAAAASTAASLFVAAWVGDVPPFTANDALQAAAAAATGSGIVGMVTYWVRNKAL